MPLTDQIGIRALLWTGKTVATPPPTIVTQSLTKIEITNNSDGQDGFDLTFTEPVDAASAGDVASYKLRQFTYAYREEYGGPEVDEKFPNITKATVSADKTANKSAPPTFPARKLP